MIHRAMFGSLERFTGVLIENYAGHFPLWLAPLQAVVATIVSDADDYAQEVLEKLKAAGLRAEIDLRNEKINYKVREHSLAKVPVLLVVGKREAEEGKVSIRRSVRGPDGDEPRRGDRRAGRRGAAARRQAPYRQGHRGGKVIRFFADEPAAAGLGSIGTLSSGRAADEPSVEIQFPLEFVVEGVPLSLQASASGLTAWKERLRAAARPLLPEGHFATEDPIKVTIYYFSTAQTTVDLDNTIKPILDAFSRYVYIDDVQVEHLDVRRFEPGRLVAFSSPSPKLAAAIDGQGPRVYLRIDVSIAGEVT